MAEAAREKAELEARAVAAAAKGAGLLLLKQVMVRLMKGEVAMRVMVWKTAQGREKADLEARATAATTAAAKGAGLLLLKQVMVRMMKGEVAMRVVVWEAAMRTAADADRLAAEAQSEQRRTLEA